jgi:hypothetical protein
LARIKHPIEAVPFDLEIHRSGKVRKMSKSILWIMVVLALLMGGCSSPLNNSSANGTVPSGNVLFTDDFSDPKSGWETWTEPSGSMVAYQNGGLRIFINEKQFDYWSRPGKRYVDIRVEVDAIKIGGPNDNDYGLICRYQDRDNFYAFLISSDGYGGILKVKDGKFQILGEKQLKYFDSIRQGEALNRLRGDCVGSELTLSVNGNKLLSQQDSDLQSGEIGVLAGTGEKPGADIFFDNFGAYKP